VAPNFFDSFAGRQGMLNVLNTMASKVSSLSPVRSFFLTRFM
jgi:hypothetical protein